MSKTISLSIPLTAAERLEKSRAIHCCGCGKIAPNQIKSCDCASMVGYRMEAGKIVAHLWLTDPNAPRLLSTADRAAIREALKEAKIMLNEASSGYISHSASDDDWIRARNKFDTKLAAALALLETNK